MEFKKLDIKPEGSWLKRTFESKHTRKTLIYMVLGAVAGFVFFIITEGKQFSEITTGDVFKSMFFGGLLGFFVTNSPCARGRC